MFRSFVVGLGRSGVGLHLRVLSEARAAEGELFHSGPVIAHDPAKHAPLDPHEVTTTPSVRAAVPLLDPERTVVHVCTPPNRLAILTELAENGFRRFIVEKPLATDVDELHALRALRRRYGLDLVVVSHWLDAELTDRLESLVRRAELGELRSITFAQHKPRFTRTAAANGHPTAFDVEIPHSLGVVLRLAGPAQLRDAEWTDMHGADGVHPRMGSARLALRHETGVVSEIFSDLTSPVQQRRIELEFTGGRVTGHYPLSEHDDHAQLVLADERQVFRDDALTRFVLRAYRHFHDPVRHDHGTFDLHCDIVRLVADAKAHCAASAAVPPERKLEHVR